MLPGSKVIKTSTLVERRNVTTNFLLFCGKRLNKAQFRSKKMPIPALVSQLSEPGR